MLSALAVNWRLDVHAIRTGHPGDFFYPGQVLGHAQALAVDIRALDGIPVLDQEFSAWKACMQAGLAAGAVRAIGPQNIGRFTATDDAHKDHVHLDLVV